MKKCVILIAGALLLAGCQTYKVQKGVKSPFTSGYVVTYRGFTIPEYTIGEDNKVPADLELAQERFKRRKETVDYYYMQLGDIKSYFNEFFIRPMSSVTGVMTSPVRVPITAYYDHKYDRDLQYRAKVDKIEDEKDTKEQAKIKVIRDYLNKYIQDDLAYEKTLPPRTPKVYAEAFTKQAEKVPETSQTVEPVSEEAAQTPSVETGQAQQPVQEEVAVTQDKQAQESVSQQPSQQEQGPEVKTQEEAAVASVKASEVQQPMQIETEKTEEKPAESVASEKIITETKQVQEPQILKTEEQASQAQVTAAQELPKEEVAAAQERPVQPAVASEQAVEPSPKKEKVGFWKKIKSKFSSKPKPVKEEVVSPAAEEVKPEKKPNLWNRMFGPKPKKEEVAPQPTEEVQVEKKPGLWQRMFGPKPKKEEKPKELQIKTTEAPTAVIVAVPRKGYSPLRVKFSGGRSRAKKGRIVSYHWEFGDGDVSKKESAVNTFYSGSFDPKDFTVTLTVQDDSGNTATTTATITILNK